MPRMIRAEASTKLTDSMLLPCPFCGHSALLRADSRDGGWTVECPNVQHGTGPDACPVSPSTLPSVSASAAIGFWNTRRPIQMAPPLDDEEFAVALELSRSAAMY